MEVLEADQRADAEGEKHELVLRDLQELEVAQTPDLLRSRQTETVYSTRHITGAATAYGITHTPWSPFSSLTQHTLSL